MRKAIVRQASMPKDKKGFYSTEVSDGETLVRFDLGQSGLGVGTFIKYVYKEPAKKKKT